MEGASYVSAACRTDETAGKAASGVSIDGNTRPMANGVDGSEAKVQMRGTYTENKGGIMACKGQAAKLMAKCQPDSAKVQSTASYSTANRFSPLDKGSSMTDWDSGDSSTNRRG